MDTRRVMRPLQRHGVMTVGVLVASIVAMIVYNRTHVGKPPKQFYENEHLDTLSLLGDQRQIRSVWRDDDFECLGWRATYGCDPNGLQDPSRDRSCTEPLPKVSGYCEVRNRSSGQVHRVMLSTCKSWRWRSVRDILTCNDARAFTDFSVVAAQYEHPEPLVLPTDPSASRGIVLIAYPKVIAGVFAIVRLLRHVGCMLPVEIWIDPNEMHARHSVLRELTGAFNCTVRIIHDPSATKFYAKPHALYHSRFESVLFLDSDNIPARDPTYLFELPEFEQHAAIFWPDFWRPTTDTPFNVHEQSALWSLLDMPFIDMFEQESGQLLVNRRKSARALNKLMFYAMHQPRLLTHWSLIYGDKDMFRLAWLNASTPFYYTPHLPALGGRYDEHTRFFCGVSMVQRDPSGQIAFFHRNQVKLDGRDDQQPLLTHLQMFTGGDAHSPKQVLDRYYVDCFPRRLGPNSCFGLRSTASFGEAELFQIDDLTTTPYPALEKQAIAFSIEGRRLMSPAEAAEISKIEDKERHEYEEEMARKAASLNQENQTLYLLIGSGLFFVCGGVLKWYSTRVAKHKIDYDYGEPVVMCPISFLDPNAPRRKFQKD
ncbi:TPA: hypothetical protein N0F65_003108 [Lagenidium giganteum]|uniref:Uncharacterized protein n=1 Tax=Lagenidium giganteum TaxID=4803 RepID=A0AAV2YSZ6_9STRA|nr:TPA: hypothetical protein N0F65_003108 [Lagenidium giganteum]